MILLTGGTGFVGRHLAQQFVIDGRSVRVLSRRPGLIALPGVSWAAGDLNDPSSLAAALEGIHTVVHAAAKLAVRDRGAPELESINADGTAAIARAARAAGVRRFCQISSGGVYGDGATAVPHVESDEPRPGNAYERSKLAAERALISALAGSDVTWIVLRPQGLYAADRPATAAMFREVAARRVWIHGAPRVVVHPTYIDDLVSAVRLAIDCDTVERDVFNIGGSRALDLTELIALIGARMAHTPHQWRVPRFAGRSAAAIGRAWAALGTPPAALLRQGRAWINRAVSIDKARRVLGFEPVPLELGLDATAAQLRQAA